MRDGVAYGVRKIQVARYSARLWLTLALAVSLLTPPAAAQAATADVAMTGTVSPSRVVPGGMVSISASVSAASVLNPVNVALEVRDASGARVFQQVVPAQSFLAGQSRNFATRWRVPSTVLP